MEYRVDRHGDTTITIRQINIKNIKEWDKMMGRSASSPNHVSMNSQISEESHSPLISPISKNTTDMSDLTFNYKNELENSQA